MKTDGKFTVNKKRIKFDAYGHRNVIAATGDWHADSMNHDREKMVEYFEKCRQKNAWLIGTGDYLDIMSSSERQQHNKVEYHDQTKNSFDLFVIARVKELADLVKKYFDNRIIGLASGNHYYTLSSGITSDELLCHELNCLNLGVNSLTRVSFDYSKSPKNQLSLDVCVHHGLSGGRTCGASINKLQSQANFFSADVVLQGHDHNRCIDYINRLGLSHNGTFENKKILLARTGSFLKSYQKGKTSYAVDKLYPPSDLGGILIYITPTRNRKTVDGVKEEHRFLDIEAVI